MATKKTTKSASTTKKKAAPAKRPTAPKAATTKVRTVSALSSKTKTFGKLDGEVVNVVLAELLGTFVLTMVALLTLQSMMPLYVGLTLAVLVYGIGTISGSHVNPAVSFGLWAAGKLKTILVPFYWGAQLLGAMGAVVIMNLVSSSQMGLDFGHFADFHADIFTVEMVGTAVFLFGFYLVMQRADVSNGHKALGIGLSLTAGLLVASSMFATVQSNVDQTKISSKIDESTNRQVLTNVPHALMVKGPTLNPAVALASSENTDSQLQNQPVQEDESVYTRFGLEVIVGTLIGAAVGANLGRLVSTRFKS